MTFMKNLLREFVYLAREEGLLFALEVTFYALLYRIRGTEEVEQ